MNRHPRRWLWRAGTVLCALVVVATLAPQSLRLFTGSMVGSTAGPAESCRQGQAIPILDSPHVAEDQMLDEAYNSNPPTSGPHYAFTVTPGIYEEPIPDGLMVHALEHGHVAVQYANDTPPDVVLRLRTVANSRAGQVLLAPYRKLPHGIALTSWGCLRIVPTFDEQVITDFVDQNAGRYEHGWQPIKPEEST